MNPEPWTLFFKAPLINFFLVLTESRRGTLKLPVHSHVLLVFSRQYILHQLQLVCRGVHCLQISRRYQTSQSGTMVSTQLLSDGLFVGRHVSTGQIRYCFLALSLCHSWSKTFSISFIWNYAAKNLDCSVVRFFFCALNSTSSSVHHLCA